MTGRARRQQRKRARALARREPPWFVSYPVGWGMTLASRMCAPEIRYLRVSGTLPRLTVQP
jgi:hypothetical protein